METILSFAAAVALFFMYYLAYRKQRKPKNIIAVNRSELMQERLKTRKVQKKVS